MGLKIWLYFLNKSLEQELKITISPEKTKISHFGEDSIKFMGTYLSISKVIHKKMLIDIQQEVRHSLKLTKFKWTLNFLFKKLWKNWVMLKNYKKGGELVPFPMLLPNGYS